jgi:FAD/FMN-containing dehydrogenase
MTATTIAPGAIQNVIAEIADIPHSQDAGVLRRKSRDFYWTSPVLKKSLDACLADLVVTPRTEADVIRLAAACVRYGVPITPRGGGTGNYGQSVPLHGGVVVDFTSLDAVLAISDGEVLTQAGTRMGALDAAVRQEGLELLHFPSTKQTATVGGYFAGGSAGVGAVAHGGLREPNNLLGARIVTIEEQPRLLDLDAVEAQAVMHSFGTMGLITRIRMPLAPARRWIGTCVAFPTFKATVDFMLLAVRDTALEKKLLCGLDEHVVAHMRKFSGMLGSTSPAVVAMIAPDAWDRFATMVADHRGEIRMTQDVAQVEADKSETPVYEYSYGHTTLLAMKTDPYLSYTQILCPLDLVHDTIAALDREFPGHVLHHVEFTIFDGEMFATFFPLIKGSTPEMVDQVAAACEREGSRSANPHVSTVSGGAGYKGLAVDLFAFKRHTDPHGLLNPGRL